jgi:Flp pilus assembly secretin CpaC
VEAVETEPVPTDRSSSAPQFELAPEPPMQLAAPSMQVVKKYTDQELASAVLVELESQGAREVQIDGAIQSLMVSQERVCRALASDGRIYLVGGELGESIVEVRSSSHAEPKLLRVKVIAPWQRSHHGVADLDQLLHAVRPLCPDSKLSIRAQEDGSIVVQGKVDSRETAKRVLELTRKLILVPVVDKLEVR